MIQTYTCFDKCLLNFIMLSFFFILVFAIFEPDDKWFKFSFESLFSFFIMEYSVFIEFDLPTMPVAKPSIWINISVIEYFAKCTAEFFLFWSYFCKEEYNGLEEILKAVTTVLLYKSLEAFFVSLPMLNDVALLVENTAEQNIHLDIRFYVMLELDLI